MTATPESGLPLVLVPGLNNTPAIWKDVLPLLAQGLVVHAPLVPAQDTVEAIAAEMLATLPTRFALCGFSFGGYVALAMLAAAPERIGPLMMLSTGPAPDSPEQATGREKAIGMARAGRYLELIQRQAGFVMHPSRNDDPALKQARDVMVRDYGVERFLAHQQAALKRPDRTALLASHRGPTWVGCGEQDRVYPAERARALAASIPGATLTLFPECGHLVPMEQPRMLADTFHEWLGLTPAAKQERK